MKLKEKNAISLIVLVITILVLSILAATVIISLSNTNIISQANDAVKKTEEQQIEEAKTLMYADGMLGNTPEDMTIGDTIISWDNENKKVVYKQLYGNLIKENVPIPTGFYYVGGTKDTGLVISDNSADENKGVEYTCVGNQFVWIPVDDYSAFKRGTAEETYEGSEIYKMTGALDTSLYIEPNTENEWEVEEYNAMCESVEKYKGFYIARFEAGIADTTKWRNDYTDDPQAIVSKKNVNVYNWVVWGDSTTDTGTMGAVYLSQNMYKNHSSVKSTLCYGVQWDATLNFVSDAEHNINNSTSWGNYEDSTGAAETGSGNIRSTGSNEAWQAKNVYDLAGNVREWTMEVYSSGERFCRGGTSGFDGSEVGPASDRLRQCPSAPTDWGEYLRLPSCTIFEIILML